MKNFFIYVFAIMFLIGCKTNDQNTSDLNIKQENRSHEEAIAFVNTLKITVNQKKRLNNIILKTLFDKFAEKNKINVTSKEIKSFIRNNQKTIKQLIAKREKERKKLIAELKDKSLSTTERHKLQEKLKKAEHAIKINREVRNNSHFIANLKKVAKRNVMNWKINKALYTKYGGRVIFQQGGPEPIDAYRKFLKEQEQKGSFEILDEKCADKFWNYFTNENMHTFYSEDDGKKFIITPWWELKK